MAKIAIMGFGTVGAGVAEVARMNRDTIAQRLGEEVYVKYILDVRDFAGSPYADRMIKDFSVIEADPEVGHVLTVAGADLMDGTPILDVKPYIPYADAHPEASGGFTGNTGGAVLEVEFPPALLARVPADKRAALAGVLARDPRPPYQHDPDRVYGLAFAGLEVRFIVAGNVLTVTAVEPAGAGGAT